MVLVMNNFVVVLACVALVAIVCLFGYVGLQALAVQNLFMVVVCAFNLCACSFFALKIAGVK